MPASRTRRAHSSAVRTRRAGCSTSDSWRSGSPDPADRREPAPADVRDGRGMVPRPTRHGTPPVLTSPPATWGDAGVHQLVSEGGHGTSAHASAGSCADGTWSIRGDGHARLLGARPPRRPEPLHRGRRATAPCRSPQASTWILEHHGQEVALAWVYAQESRLGVPVVPIAGTQAGAVAGAEGGGARRPTEQGAAGPVGAARRTTGVGAAGTRRRG
jgi:hypothetical protein